MTIAVLTFGQEIWKTIIGAIATAAFLTLFGYFAAERWGKARDEERKAEEKARDEKRAEDEKARDLKRAEDEKAREREREEFELKTQLVERISRTAADMFIACQHASRVLKDNQGTDQEVTTRRNNVIDQLDRSYHLFSVESASLETQLGVRYGIAWHLPPHDEESQSEVFVKWHQIRDLLTLYYFNLKGNFPGDSFERNSKGHKGRYHSGLKLEEWVSNAKSPKPDELDAMRVAIRKTYTPALEKLVENMLRDPVEGITSTSSRPNASGSEAGIPT